MEDLYDIDALRGMYFDKEGRELSLMEYARLHNSEDYVRIGWDRLPDGGHLSTVWLGINHSFFGGPPVIFETMRFPECDPCIRYHTLAEARAGHVAELKRQRKWSVRIARRWGEKMPAWLRRWLGGDV